MAEIIEQEKSQKGAKRRPKKGTARVDMTPMVDLMCLLITFFMLTTAFSKPKVMEITMPDKEKPKGKDDGVRVAANRTYHILLSGNDKIYWYNGLIKKGEPIPELHQTTYGKDGIRKLLLEKNKKVFTEIANLKDQVLLGKIQMADSVLNRKIREIKKADKHAPIILIKADDKAKYRNIVDIIDEMAICNIGAYVVVDIAPEEIKLMEGKLK